MPDGLELPSKNPIPAASVNAVPPPAAAELAGRAGCAGPGLCAVAAGSLAVAVTTGAGVSS